MPREILPGLHWFYEPGPDRTEMVTGDGDGPDWYDPDGEVYIPQCAYLFEGDDETLLFDTLSPASREEILSDVEAALDGRDLDYLVVSHPDVPHAGNATALLDAYPEAELVAPKYGNDHELYHLDDATHVGEGDSIDLGGYVLDFHEATFLDAPVSVWMTERTNDMLLPVDWLGYPHAEHEMLSFVDELDHDLDLGRLLQFHGRVLFWHQYVNVEKVQREIDWLVDHYDPEWILPAHGLVVREDPTEYMDLMKDVVAEINERDRIGILG
ncbi:MBL fold metallo-hydrolase [Halorussus halobius]|uniref:MBL fold metallo-hydrolase n=1 Tax=Halorussus halobius TaxID=1710537 RepID=UPI0010922245|nr:MBL fold metallo-hydrolase [Halorussus halobius]